MDGVEVGIIFDEIGDMLEILGENPYKIRAYRNAAHAVMDCGQDLEEVWRAGRLKSIPGIGDAIAGKIDELMRTGSLGFYHELAGRVPSGVREMMSIPGLGPRTIRTIYEHTGIDNLEDLVKAAEEKRLRVLPGLGAKTEYNIKKGAQLLSGITGRVTLGTALPVALDFLTFLKAAEGVVAAEPCGSVRRGKPLVGDVDILVATRNPEAAKDRVRRYRRLKAVEREGTDSVAGKLILGIPFEVIMVAPEEFGRKLVECTGSKEHVKRLREIGLDDILPAGRSEREVFAALGLPYIPPEMRENRGELEAALDGRLPEIIQLGDIKGDLHCHTDWSDGAHSLMEMVEHARQLGYEYLAITDHSQSLTISGGLKPDRLSVQRKAIEGIDTIKVLAGSEVDILKDGRLDFDDELLSELDVVIASIHSHFKLDREKQTARVEAAMKHPGVDIIGHLTGRLLNRRPGYEVDVDYLLQLAARTQTALEINSHPDRLDISEEIARQCHEMGIKVAINSDAHQAPDLDLMSYGVMTARRGWLTGDDVINSWPAEKLERWLQNRKS